MKMLCLSVMFENKISKSIGINFCQYHLISLKCQIINMRDDLLAMGLGSNDIGYDLQSFNDFVWNWCTSISYFLSSPCPKRLLLSLSRNFFSQVVLHSPPLEISSPSPPTLSCTACSFTSRLPSWCVLMQMLLIFLDVFWCIDCYFLKIMKRKMELIWWIWFMNILESK